MTDRPARWRFGCTEWGCVGASLVVAAVFLLPLFVRGTDDHRHPPSCQSHIGQLMLGMLAYAQDWDERLPHVQTWAPGLKPYLTGKPASGEITLYRCPQDLRFSHDRGDQVPSIISYAMVPRWSLQYLLASDDTSSMVLLYDVGPVGPAYRHDGGIYVGLGDGHVKLVPRKQLSLRAIQSGRYRSSIQK